MRLHVINIDDRAQDILELLRLFERDAIAPAERVTLFFVPDPDEFDGSDEPLLRDQLGSGFRIEPTLRTTRQSQEDPTPVPYSSDIEGLIRDVRREVESASPDDVVVLLVDVRLTGFDSDMLEESGVSGVPNVGIWIAERLVDLVDTRPGLVHVWLYTRTPAMDQFFQLDERVRLASKLQTTRLRMMLAAALKEAPPELIRTLSADENTGASGHFEEIQRGLISRGLDFLFAVVRKVFFGV